MPAQTFEEGLVRYKGEYLLLLQQGLDPSQAKSRLHNLYREVLGLPTQSGINKLFRLGQCELRVEEELSITVEDD